MADATFVMSAVLAIAMWGSGKLIVLAMRKSS
jgi:hypothetical protein